MDVPGASHYYMKEVSSGPTSTVAYSYLGCNPANIDSNDFYGDVSWAYIQGYPVSSAGASWKKSVASDYWIARDMMRAKDYQGAYNLCMDLFNDAKTENRSECLQLAMQAAKKLHVFAKEEEFLKKSLKDEDAAVREAAEVWLSILYEHTKAFEKAQAMIGETKLTGDSKLSMLFNLAAAYDDAGYDDKAVELFYQMIKEFPEEEKEVLGFLREMDRGGGSADDELGKQTAEAAESDNAVDLFPNPFNAATKIAYHLETTGRVRISVYDILGRQVRLLLDELQDSGAHVLNWDGRSSSGLPVSSGLYFIRIQSPDFSRMIKAVAVK